jgi:hypothetical protein
MANFDRHKFAINRTWWTPSGPARVYSTGSPYFRLYEYFTDLGWASLSSLAGMTGNTKDGG